MWNGSVGEIFSAWQLVSWINYFKQTFKPLVFYSFDGNYVFSEVKDNLQKYESGKWRNIPAEDRLKLTKMDAQVWISLLNLLLKPDCQRKYDFNNFNKNQLLKLRGFLTEVVIDQLPNLADLQRFLGHLSVTDPSPPKKDLILEQPPEIWNEIVAENSGKWNAIAKHQVQHVFNPSERDLRKQANRLGKIYNLDVMECLVPDKPKCGFCGSVGTKRCSRCQGEWYCNRECQVKHWPKHRPACKMIAETPERDEYQDLRDSTAY